MRFGSERRTSEIRIGSKPATGPAAAAPPPKPPVPAKFVG